MNIFIANLNYKVKSEKLQEIFGEYGDVSSAKIIFDRDSKRSKGFGFVEMPNDEEGYSAIQGLNDTELDNSQIVVKKSEPRSSGGGGGRDNRRRQGGFRERSRY